MDKILMHKEKEVAVVSVRNGMITDIKAILDEKHMPVGTYLTGRDPGLCGMYLQAWQRSRALPDDRLNLERVTAANGTDVFEMSEKSFCISMTDSYWLWDTEHAVTWAEVCEIRKKSCSSLLTLTGEGEAVPSPDYATNGTLPKAWTYAGKVPLLIKDAPPWLPTASANEVVAYRLAHLCGVSHVPYYPFRLGDKVYCATPCFVDQKRQEFVPFQQYARIHRIPAWQRAMCPPWQLAMDMGLEEEFLRKMTAFDLLIGNTDRHTGNFGMLLDPDTMCLLGAAPLFDSGTSLYQYNGSGLSFIPFFRGREKAKAYIDTVPFIIPEEGELKSLVEEVYAEFSLDKYASAAAEELCKNAAFLKE